MKKTLALVLVVLLTLSATAFAAIPSKTTTNVTTVAKIENAAGESWTIEVAEDSEEVVAEITKLFTFANEQKQAPAKYFPEETQKAIVEKFKDDASFDLEKLELNDFVTLKQVDYKQEYKDASVTFKFATTYKPQQKVVPMMGVYTGEKDADGNFIVVWIVLDGEVLEDGSVKVNFTEEALLAMQSAKTVAFAVLSEA